MVLSFGFWSEHFGADPDIAGKHINISNIPATVVGVTPPAFQGVRLGADVKVYLPLQFAKPLLTQHLDIDSPAWMFMCSRNLPFEERNNYPSSGERSGFSSGSAISPVCSD